MQAGLLRGFAWKGSLNGAVQIMLQLFLILALFLKNQHNRDRCGRDGRHR